MLGKTTVQICHSACSHRLWNLIVPDLLAATAVPAHRDCQASPSRAVIWSLRMSKLMLSSATVEPYALLRSRTATLTCQGHAPHVMS